jgi:hypothetical protein
LRHSIVRISLYTENIALGTREETEMFMREMIGSCSLAPVAEAAVISIGTAFFRRVAAVAETQGVSVGLYAARAVRHFSASARAQDWNDLIRLCAGQDMPVLCAIHHILETAMQEEERKSSHLWSKIAPPGASEFGQQFY